MPGGTAPGTVGLPFGQPWRAAVSWRRRAPPPLPFLADTVRLRYSLSMSDKHLRYYYDIHYLGKELATGNEVKRNVIMESSEIAPQVFPYQPLETAQPIPGELAAVSAVLMTDLPADIAEITDYTIERKDEFEEIFGVTRTASRLICKWTSHQTFILSAKQEEIFKLIEEQLKTISLKWGEWKELFGPSSKHLQMMQETAPTSFSIYRESLMHDVMLSIRRLFDPAFNQRRNQQPEDNFTFAWLAENLDQGNKRKEFADALNLMKPKIEFLTTWRHKVLAHNDYEHGVNQQLLPSVKIDEIQAVIKEMSDLMNIIQLNLSTNHQGRYCIYYDVNARGGGSFLMGFIKRGVDQRNAALENMKKRQQNWTEPSP